MAVYALILHPLDVLWALGIIQAALVFGGGLLFGGVIVWMLRS